MINLKAQLCAFLSIVGNEKENIVNAALSQLEKFSPQGRANDQKSRSSIPPLWDGQAGKRIINILANHICDHSRMNNN